MTLDASNMKQLLNDFALQCREALDLPKGMSVTGRIDNILCVGMGGSAIAGDLLKAVSVHAKTPVDVVRDYAIPGYVNKNTLVFALSFSGKTEETVDATEAALRAGAKVVGISRGGHLAGMCSKFIRLPKQMQPRCALGYLFFPMLGVCHNSGLIEISNTELNELLSLLSTPAQAEKRASQIVKSLGNKTPIFYSSERLRPIAMRAKTQVNENAKAPAFFNTFSEMNHNEICGYERMAKSQYAPVLIRSEHDNPRISKRMDVIKDMWESNHVTVEEIFVKGNSILTQLCTGVQLVDYLSYILAIDKRVDPTPVTAIDQLKKRMSE